LRQQQYFDEAGPLIVLTGLAYRFTSDVGQHVIAQLLARSASLKQSQSLPVRLAPRSRLDLAPIPAFTGCASRRLLQCSSCAPMCLTVGYLPDRAHVMGFF